MPKFEDFPPPALPSLGVPLPGVPLPVIPLTPIAVYKRLDFNGFQLGTNLGVTAAGVTPTSPPQFAINALTGRVMGGLLPGITLPKPGVISDPPTSFDLISLCFGCAGPAANGVANPALSCSLAIFGTTLTGPTVNGRVTFLPAGGTSQEMLCVQTKDIPNVNGQYKALKSVSFGVNDPLTQGQVVNLLIDNIEVKYN